MSHYDERGMTAIPQQAFMRPEPTLTGDPRPSPEPHTPASRPGGRSARVRAEVVAATLAEVTERGYDGLTVEAVAARSGVHKATLYRRWGGVDGLVADALTASADRPWPVPDTGDLQQDLRRITREVLTAFTDPALGPTPTALISAAQRSDTGAAALRSFFAARHHQAAQVAERAVSRGELPAGTDGAEVVRAATAPLYYRLFVSGEPLDAHTAERAADAATLAARAGLFTPTSTSPEQN
ncbi:TetR/AcrR family transcriptional regulator [Kitasatospora sp. NPDC056651]|uniref:TetR/AcrR family transcriptional regulator n=1 Tax=Kitasatospora sp. NPDC056651 TaxID=3345892 RepID=UPI0036A76CF9